MDHATSITNKHHIDPFAKAASLEIKAMMARTETRYEDLSRRLAEQGVELSASNLRNKVSGHSLSAGLFLMILSLLSNKTEITVAISK